MGILLFPVQYFSLTATSNNVGARHAGGVTHTPIAPPYPVRIVVCGFHEYGPCLSPHWRDDTLIILRDGRSK